MRIGKWEDKVGSWPVDRWALADGLDGMAQKC